jgi:hypothetical protein
MQRPSKTTLGLAAALVAATSFGAPAQAFVAENFKPVAQSGPERFVVGYRGDSVVREFWCAAGDYVIRGLGRGPATRIWRISGRRTGGQGIEFALNPDGAQPPGITILGGDGASLTAAAAWQLCEKRRIFPDEDFN